jgi:hypothetical protein
MSINREDLNKYYDLINNLVDEYVIKWKIRPSKLKKYLKPGSKNFNNFLLRNNLSEVSGASIILKDIINDREHMEIDGVLTYENFKLYESNNSELNSLKDCFYKGIEKADIRMEKILADHFDTNLSDIDIIDSNKHLFKVKSWSKTINVIIFSKDDIDIIKENIIEFLYSKLINKTINLEEIIDVKLDMLITNELFTQKVSDMINEDKLINLISTTLNTNVVNINNSSFFVFSKNM